MVRGVVGFVVGAVVWLVAFNALTTFVGLFWREYVALGQVWFETGVFAFEPEMAVATVIAWVVAEILAGWVAVAIGRRRQVAWILAIAIGGYLVALHIVLNWADFPWWYNVAVAGLAVPAVLLGGKLGGDTVRSVAPAH